MHYETTRITPSSLQRTWKVLTDVENWPTFIAPYESVRRLDDGPLALGSIAEIKEKGLPTATWRVTELVEFHDFGWQNSQFGVSTTARHLIAEEPDGRIRLTLAIDQTGWLAGLAGWMLGRRIRGYVDAEADALAAAAAGPHQAPGTAADHAA